MKKRQTFAELYTGPGDGNMMQNGTDTTEEWYQSFLKEMNLKNKEFQKELYGRVGLLTSAGATGWASDETDIGFAFEDGYLSEKGIKAAESLAASFEREAYYSYLQPDKGAEEEIIPWVMSIVIGWAGGKLLDWVVKKLKEPSNKQIANQISKEWSETESSGEVNIRIRDQQDDLKSADIIIPGYPGNINEITEKKISELKEKTH